MPKSLKLIAANLAVLAALVVLIEAALQGFAMLRPSYEVLFLQPDRGMGWTEVPDLKYRWAGSFWRSVDFSVDVANNSRGFRDKAREVSKPDGTKRVAMLGDSFIEANQVPLEQTASAILDRNLNAPANPVPPGKWEVLSFGVSNYGVGQYLLAWEQHAKNYQPDYVTIFVAKFHMERTVTRYEYGAFSATADGALWVRPSFRVENGQLIREPARDFEKFSQIQEALIKERFGEDRSIRRTPWILPIYYRELRGRLKERFGSPQPDAPPPNADAEKELYAINGAIIEELGRQVKDAGAKLVILDASRYFGDEDNVTDFLKGLAETHGFGYVAVFEDLMKANRDGIATRWERDGHLNVVGNRIFADSITAWVKQDAK